MKLEANVIQFIIMHQVVVGNMQQLLTLFSTFNIHMTIRLNAVFCHADCFAMGGLATLSLSPSLACAIQLRSSPQPKAKANALQCN